MLTARQGNVKEDRINLVLINVRSWKAEKLEEVCKEMEEVKLDCLAITHTNLRGNVDERFKEFRMFGKGRDHFTKQGGGVGPLYVNK